MKHTKKTMLQVITTFDKGQWRHVVIFSGEYTTRKLREGVIDDGPVTAYTATSTDPVMLEISLEDGEAVGIHAIEL